MIIESIRKEPDGAPQCPYCGSETRKTQNNEIYGGKQYGRGLVYVCVNFPKCDTYVGCHGKGKALGIPAGRRLRRLKRRAHDLFDPLWRDGHITRSKAYRLLSKKMGLSPKETHIGWFGDRDTEKAIEAIKEIRKEVYNR